MIELWETIRAPICGLTGLRCDTWYLFVDPGIIRFFGEGVRETLLLSVVSVLLSSQATAAPIIADSPIAIILTMMVPLVIYRTVLAF